MATQEELNREHAFYRLKTKQFLLDLDSLIILLHKRPSREETIDHLENE